MAEEKKKTPEYQIRATREWKQKNKERNKLLSYRATAKLYARKHATEREMLELMDIFYNENPNGKK